MNQPLASLVPRAPLSPGFNSSGVFDAGDCETAILGLLLDAGDALYFFNHAGKHDDLDG
jgi:hypothetical protein